MMIIDSSEKRKVFTSFVVVLETLDSRHFHFRYSLCLRANYSLYLQRKLYSNIRVCIGMVINESRFGQYVSHVSILFLLLLRMIFIVLLDTCPIVCVCVCVLLCKRIPFRHISDKTFLFTET